MVTEKWGIDELSGDGLRKTIEEHLEKGAQPEDTTKIAYAAFQHVYGACFGLQELLQRDDTITNQKWVEFLKLKNKETYAGLKQLVKEETKTKIKKMENTGWAKLPLLGGEYKRQEYENLTETCKNITRSIDNVEQFFVYGADRSAIVWEKLKEGRRRS